MRPGVRWWGALDVAVAFFVAVVLVTVVLTAHGTSSADARKVRAAVELDRLQVPVTTPHWRTYATPFGSASLPAEPHRYVVSVSGGDKVKGIFAGGHGLGVGAVEIRFPLKDRIDQAGRAADLQSIAVTMAGQLGVDLSNVTLLESVPGSPAQQDLTPGCRAGVRLLGPNSHFTFPCTWEADFTQRVGFQVIRSGNRYLLLVTATRGPDHFMARLSRSAKIA